MKIYISIPYKYYKEEIEIIKLKGRKKQRIFKVRLEKEENVKTKKEIEIQKEHKEVF